MSQDTRELNMLPFSFEAEQFLLSSIYQSLNYSDGVEALNIFSKVNYDYFYSLQNQIIYQILKDLYESGKHTDITTIDDYIKSKEMDKELSGIDLFLYLETGPSMSKSDSFINIIEDKYTRRELKKLSDKFRDYAFDEKKDINYLLSQADSDISKFSQKRGNEDLFYPSDVLSPMLQDILDEQERFINNLPPKKSNKLRTGNSTFDDFFNGGLNPSDLILIGGRPAMGKSTFVLNLCLGLAKNGHMVYFSTLEMSKEQLHLKLLSLETGIPLIKLQNGLFNNADKDKVLFASANISKLLIILDEDTSINPNKMKARIRTLQNKHKDKKIVGVVDYLQLIELSDSKNENRTQEISKISRGLKKLARALNIPFIALSQLSRKVEERSNKRPLLSDLREGGSLEQDCDICLFLYRDEYYNPNSEKTRIADAIVAKYRNGATGTMEFYFEGTTSKFTGLER